MYTVEHVLQYKCAKCTFSLVNYLVLTIKTVVLTNFDFISYTGNALLVYNMTTKSFTK